MTGGRGKEKEEGGRQRRAAVYVTLYFWSYFGGILVLSLWLFFVIFVVICDILRLLRG